MSPTTVNPHMVHESNTTVFTSKPYPQVPHSCNFWTVPGMMIPPLPFFQCLTTFLSEEIFLNSIFNWLFPNIQSNDSSTYKDCSYGYLFCLLYNTYYVTHLFTFVSSHFKVDKSKFLGAFISPQCFFIHIWMTYFYFPIFCCAWWDTIY